MSEPRLLKITSPLARQLAQPGGRTVAEAQRLAEAGLQGHKADIMKDLGDHIARLEAICAAAADPAQVYREAAVIVDEAGFFDTGPLYAAAYSLCDLSDRMKGAGAWSWPAVEVHVKALRLIYAGGCREGAESEVLLQGLRSVLAAFA